MRSRVSVIAPLLLVGLSVAPLVAQAAGIPFLGPIIPGPQNVCPGGMGLLMTVINNIIALLITLAIVFVAPLMIAWAGFLLVVNQGEAGKISEAKKILTNLVIGIVVALAAWMIVNALMVAFYDKSKVDGKDWWTIVSGTDLCIIQRGTGPTEGLNQVTPTATGVTTGWTTALPSGTSACDPATVTSAAAAGGYTIDTREAKILACIARPESSCGSNTSTAHQPDGTPTTAAGAFQITFGAGTDKCHQLNLSVCTTAAATAVSWSGGDLNCSSVFTCSLSNPSACQPKTGKEANAAACLAAASNLDCNTAAAACLVALSGGAYTAWTSDPRSAIQTQCIDANP